jgi:hypothetical protein
MRFLIAVIDDRSNSADSGEMEAIDSFNDYLRENNHFIMACGVHDPKESVLVDNRKGAGVTLQGPLNETSEFMAGFWLITASSEDEAKELAARGSQACNRKVEIRKLHG